MHVYGPAAKLPGTRGRENANVRSYFCADGRRISPASEREKFQKKMCIPASHKNDVVVSCCCLIEASNFLLA